MMGPREVCWLKAGWKIYYKVRKCFRFACGELKIVEGKKSGDAYVRLLLVEWNGTQSQMWKQPWSSQREHMLWHKHHPLTKLFGARRFFNVQARKAGLDLQLDSDLLHAVWSRFPSPTCPMPIRQPVSFIPQHYKLLSYKLETDWKDNCSSWCACIWCGCDYLVILCI